MSIKIVHVRLSLRTVIGNGIVIHYKFSKEDIPCLRQQAASYYSRPSFFNFTVGFMQNCCLILKEWQLNTGLPGMFNRMHNRRRLSVIQSWIMFFVQSLDAFLVSSLVSKRSIVSVCSYLARDMHSY